jgi:hypothetical protein
LKLSKKFKPDEIFDVPSVIFFRYFVDNSSVFLMSSVLSRLTLGIPSCLLSLNVSQGSPAEKEIPI